MKQKEGENLLVFFKGYILNFDELSFTLNVILADQLKNEIQMTQFLIK